MSFGMRSVSSWRQSRDSWITTPLILHHFIAKPTLLQIARPTWFPFPPLIRRMTNRSSHFRISIPLLITDASADSIFCSPALFLNLYHDVRVGWMTLTIQPMLNQFRCHKKKFATTQSSSNQHHQNCAYYNYLPLPLKLDITSNILFHPKNISLTISNVNSNSWITSLPIHFSHPNMKILKPSKSNGELVSKKFLPQGPFIRRLVLFPKDLPGIHLHTIMISVFEPNWDAHRLLRHFYLYLGMLSKSQFGSAFQAYLQQAMVPSLWGLEAFQFQC